MTTFLDTKPRFYGSTPGPKPEDALPARDFIRTVETLTEGKSDAERIKLAKEGLRGEASDFIEQVGVNLDDAEYTALTTTWAGFKKWFCKKHKVTETTVVRDKALEWGKLTQKTGEIAFDYISRVGTEVSAVCQPVSTIDYMKFDTVSTKVTAFRAELDRLAALVPADSQADATTSMTILKALMLDILTETHATSEKHLRRWFTMKRVQTGLLTSEMRSKAKELINDEDLSLPQFVKDMEKFERNLDNNKKAPTFSAPVETKEVEDEQPCDIAAASSSHTAPSSNKSKKKRNKNRGANAQKSAPSVPCTYCGKFGHVVDHCKKRKADSKSSVAAVPPVNQESSQDMQRELQEAMRTLQRITTANPRLLQSQDQPPTYSNINSVNTVTEGASIQDKPSLSEVDLKMCYESLAHRLQNPQSQDSGNA